MISTRKEELLSILSKRDLDSILEENGIKLAFLFGSLMDSSGPRDVDIGVLFQSYSFDVYSATYERLCKFLGIKDIDVVVLNRSNAAIKLEALEGVLLYAENEEVISKFAVDALFEYEDYRYFREEYAYNFHERSLEGISMSERRLKKARVEAYLSKLDEAVGQLTRLRKGFSSFDDFMGDIDRRELCVHYLRIALESVLDICRHFLAVKGVNLTEIETTNIIELSGEKGLMPYAFARKIGGMAGMRNAIVHVYWRLDYEAIYRALMQDLADFDEFVRYVNAFLERE